MNEYIGATGNYPIIEYVDYTSNNNFLFTSNTSNYLNKRIDDIDIETSNISSNISDIYTQGLRNELWEVNPNNSKCLIKSITDYNNNINTHIINSNIYGEIRFTNIYTGDNPRTIIDKFGKLNVYHIFDLLKPTISEGWKDVENEITNLIVLSQINGAEIIVVQGQIAGIDASINFILGELTVLSGYNRAINLNLETLSYGIFNNEAYQRLVTDSITNLTGYYSGMINQFSAIATSTRVSQFTAGVIIPGAVTGVIGSIMYSIDMTNIHNLTSNALNSNINLTASERRQILESSSNLIRDNYNSYNSNFCNMSLEQGFINSNITTTQFIPSLKSNKIMLGNITTPNIAYQMEMTGDLNLNMLYLNSTSLTSLLNQKQGNLTFNNPLLNTTNIITLKRDSSLTIDGSGNLSVVKTATTPIVITGNDFSLNYDSSLTKISGNLSVVKTATTPIVITGNDFSLNYDASLTKVGNNLSVVKTASLPLAITGNNWALNYDSTLELSGNNLSVAAASRSKWAKRASPLLDDIYNLNVRNVGIGTDQPGTKLDVNGGITARGDMVVNFNQNDNAFFGMYNYYEGALANVLFLFNTYSTSGRIELYNALNTTTPNLLKISNSLGDIMITNGVPDPLIYLKRSNGNIGIGNINPSYKLDVNGNIYGRNNLYVGNSSIISSYTNATINNITGTEYKYLIYTTNGTLVLNDLLNCDILIVGGGGGGGKFGGGGGAGQVLYITNFNLPNGTYNIVVGTGGSGATDQSGNGNNGNNSSITISGTTYTSVGGGGGGSRNDSGGYYGRAGNNGGSGGGGSHSDFSSAINVGGSSTKNTYSGWTSLGNSGGEGKDGISGGYGSGGGGGAGSIGANAGTNSGGNGGAGVNLSSIFGTGVGNSGWFGGGGGGSSHFGTSGTAGFANGGSGLLGGGGNGTINGSGINGIANTGGGGGGADGYPGQVGGTGGSGVVIIRFIETGKLGLGTTTPNNKFHLEKGSAFIGDNSVGNGVQIDNGYKLIFDNSYTATGANKCNKIVLHNNQNGIGYLAGLGLEVGGIAYSTWTGGKHRFYTETTSASGGFLSFDILKDQFNFYGNVDSFAGGYIRNASAGGSAYTYLGLINNNGSFGGFFLNSSGRSVDGGANNMTIRNDAGDLILSAKNSTPQVYLQESTDRIYMKGTINIIETGGGGAYAVPTGYMQQSSLTIGSTNLSYGLGDGWNTNTAGLMLECADNTEIAVHDAGNRITSLIAYQGGTSYNNITIGRNMGVSAGWGTVWNVNIAGASLSLANEWYIVKATSPTGVINSLVFLHSTSTITSRWWLNGTQNGTSSEISDERIKKEIKDIDNPIEKLLLIKPKEYYLCSDKDYNKKYGIIAQDINKEESLKHLIYTDKEYIANLLTNAKFTKEKIGEEEPILEYPEEKYIKTEDNPTPYQRPKPKEIFKYTITTEKNLSGLINIDDELKMVLDNDDINNIEIVIDDSPYNNRYKKRFVKVKEIIDDYSFEIYEDIETTETEKDKLFIYGKKVDDFLKLDYESLYCLNIKATQELIRKNAEQEKRIEKLEELINNFLINK